MNERCGHGVIGSLRPSIRTFPRPSLRAGKSRATSLADATDEQILATGFFRNHMINGEGGRIPEENRVEYVMDMSETMGTVWLGLTLNCCRCHDHKFDPLTNEDYYQLFAFFNQTPVKGNGGDAQTAPVLATPSPQEKDRLEVIRSTYRGLDAELAEDCTSYRPRACRMGRSNARSLVERDSVEGVGTVHDVCQWSGAQKTG